jgi:hypothetical protein
MDVTKLAHIARHFPSQAPFLLGGGLIGLPPPLAPRDESGQGGSINQYLAQQVFDEATNNVPPGFAGELYINFAGPGLFLGFLALGAAHRLLRNHLLDASTPGLVTACLVLLIPSTTLVLFNSGMLPAASRSVIDTAVVLVIWRPRVAR